MFKSFTDIALQIFQDHKEVVQKEPGSVLRVLARKPYAFDETKQNIIWEIVKSSIYHLFLTLL